MKYLLSITVLYFLSFTVNAEFFASTRQKVSLLELYSSQGCSSCPPAENWVSSLLDNERLWSDFIPIVYHVDYWNYLGWRDPFSNKTYSQRQRAYHQQGSIRSVYTPGFVLNGEEWRSWYTRQSIPNSSTTSGTLIVSLVNNKLQATYDSKSPLILNIALLGFGLNTNVNAGENEGRRFNENFIVLSSQAAASSNGSWELELSKPHITNAKRYALAAWVSPLHNLTPIQATGGWLVNGFE